MMRALGQVDGQAVEGFPEGGYCCTSVLYGPQ